MSINCWGRRYPNAPFTHYSAAVRRLPPHFFNLMLSGLTDEAAVHSTANLVQASGQFLTRLYNPSISWKGGGNGFFPQFQLALHIDRDPVVWTMKIVIATHDGGLPQPDQHRQWFLTGLTGFEWEAATEFICSGGDQSPLWRWGGASTQTARIGFYGEIPAGSCSGV